jgi:CheY-like chemotaxis protein
MKILLVEDDPLVRMFAVESLEDAGFEVIEAETGEQGLAHCREALADLLFTDIRLPGAVTGWDVAEYCRSCKPDMPVIYATGFSDVGARPVPGSVFFQKPYRADQLLSTVRVLIDPCTAHPSPGR